MKNTNKKIISVTSAAALLLSLVTMANGEEGGKIYINNTVLESAELKQNNDTTLVPLRAICENLGFTVNWIEESRTIELVKLPIYITCSPDYDGYTFSKMAPQKLGTSPLLIDDTTYVPENFINEILQGTLVKENGDYYITYGEQTNTITGTVCDLVIENDKIVKIVIGEPDNIDTHIELNLTDEISKIAEELNIVIGTEIVAETTGTQTMSIPPQMTPVSLSLSEKAVLPTISGTVADIIYEDEKLVKLVLGEKENPETQTILNLTEEIAATVKELGIEVGTEITAQTQDLATLSIPPQMIPVSIEIAEKTSDSVSTEPIEGTICDLVYEDEKLTQIIIGDENAPMTQTVLNLSEELAAKAIELKAEKGKTIKATASAMKTRSLPPQQALLSIEDIK